VAPAAYQKGPETPAIVSLDLEIQHGYEKAYHSGKRQKCSVAGWPPTSRRKRRRWRQDPT
jgi:hypothetical protein